MAQLFNDFQYDRYPVKDAVTGQYNGAIMFHRPTAAQLEVARAMCWAVYFEENKQIRAAIEQNDGTPVPEKLLNIRPVKDNVAIELFNKQISHCVDVTVPHPETGVEIPVDKELPNAIGPALKKKFGMELKAWTDIFPDQKKIDIATEMWLHEHAIHTAFFKDLVPEGFFSSSGQSLSDWLDKLNTIRKNLEDYFAPTDTPGSGKSAKVRKTKPKAESPADGTTSTVE